MVNAEIVTMFFKAWCFILLLQFFGDTATNLTSTVILDAKGCVFYKDLLPEGSCINILKNHRIYQNRSKAKSIDKKYAIYFNFLRALVRLPEEQAAVIAVRTLQILRTIRYEKCLQNENFFTQFLDLKPTYNTCYEHGVQYNGTINTTSNGSTCLPWSINPYLSNGAFPMLVKNYCRNPPGYMSKPWCYIDMSFRWDICKIPTCQTAQENGRSIRHNNVIIITSVSLIAVLVLCLACVLLVYKGRRIQRRIKELDPYHVCTLDETTNKEYLLQLHSENLRKEGLNPE